MPPTLLSPSFSRHPFQAAAAAAAAAAGDQDAAASSEHPCVRTPFARAMLLERA